MINFRYHIVSLMAVFLALAVGIAVGVSLGPSVSAGLNEQAAQDRRQVTELRAELDRVAALDQYREAWAERAGQPVTADALGGVSVALVAMPDAPGEVVRALDDAVQRAGGTVVRTVEIDDAVYDPTRAQQVAAAVSPYADQVGLADGMTPATQFGRVLSWSVAAKTPQERSEQASAMGDRLQRAGFATFSNGSDRQAELVLVVTARATDPEPPPEVLQAHVQTATALLVHAGGVVVAGPNSDDITGTDVLAVRSEADAVDVLSTVDVADLPSGVTTTVLAGQEQLLGRQGHYGALTGADAPLPALPVR